MLEGIGMLTCGKCALAPRMCKDGTLRRGRMNRDRYFFFLSCALFFAILTLHEQVTCSYRVENMDPGGVPYGEFGPGASEQQYVMWLLQKIDCIKDTTIAPHDREQVKRAVAETRHRWGHCLPFPENIANIILHIPGVAFGVWGTQVLYMVPGIAEKGFVASPYMRYALDPMSFIAVNEEIMYRVKFYYGEMDLCLNDDDIDKRASGKGPPGGEVKNAGASCTLQANIVMGGSLANPDPSAPPCDNVGKACLHIGANEYKFNMATGSKYLPASFFNRFGEPFDNAELHKDCTGFGIEEQSKNFRWDTHPSTLKCLKPLLSRPNIENELKSTIKINTLAYPERNQGLRFDCLVSSQNLFHYSAPIWVEESGSDDDVRAWISMESFFDKSCSTNGTPEWYIGLYDTGDFSFYSRFLHMNVCPGGQTSLVYAFSRCTDQAPPVTSMVDEQRGDAVAPGEMVGVCPSRYASDCKPHASVFKPASIVCPATRRHESDFENKLVKKKLDAAATIDKPPDPHAPSELGSALRGVLADARRGGTASRDS